MESPRSCGHDAVTEKEECLNRADSTALLEFYLKELGQDLLLSVSDHSDADEQALSTADVVQQIQHDQHWMVDDDGRAFDCDGTGEPFPSGSLAWEADDMKEILSSDCQERDFMEEHDPHFTDGFHEMMKGVIYQEAGSEQWMVREAGDNSGNNAACNLLETGDDQGKSCKKSHLQEDKTSAPSQTLVFQGTQKLEDSLNKYQGGYEIEHHEEWNKRSRNSELGDEKSIFSTGVGDRDKKQEGFGGAAGHGRCMGVARKTNVWGRGFRSSLTRQLSDTISHCELGTGRSGTTCKQQVQLQLRWNDANVAAVKVGGAKGAGAARSKNLATERIRRQRLKEKLYTLRALVPNISKMSRASIVEDAINYVRVLRNQVAIVKQDIAQLESCKEGSIYGNPCTMQCTKQIHKSTKVNAKKHTNQVYNILKLDVTPMAGDKRFQFRIDCEKRPGVAAQLACALEALDIDIINGNLTSTDATIVSFLVIEVHGTHLVTSEDVGAYATEALKRFGLLFSGQLAGHTNTLITSHKYKAQRVRQHCIREMSA